MTHCITVHGTALSVSVTAEDAGHFKASSRDWPGHDGHGTTPEAAIRRLAGLLDLAADRAVYQARTRDLARFAEEDVRPEA